jgi:hypothetical protein
VTGNGIEHAQAALERAYPDWMIWRTSRPVGTVTWCARRWDDSGGVLHAGTAEDLADAIVRAEMAP